MIQSVDPGSATLAPTSAPRWPRFALELEALEPLTRAELGNLLRVGDGTPDDLEMLLARTARSQGAVEVAIGEGLAAMQVGKRLISLGHSNLGDYAREVLGIGERKAQDLAHLARALAERPLLRAAVRSGAVRVRNAQTVLPVARGAEEAGWVERARTETVRSLEAAVKKAREGLTEDDEERWTVLRVNLPDEDRAVVDEALRIGARVLPTATRAQLFEAMAQEYLGEHSGAAPESGDRSEVPSLQRAREVLEKYKARLEEETLRWEYLPEVETPRVPEAEFDGLHGAREIHARLLELVEVREKWDGLLGYAAWMVKAGGIWHTAGFADFEHYCAERLGMSASTVERRAAVEKRLWERPALRAARAGGLPYEKVRLLLDLPEAELEAWLPQAKDLSVLELRRKLEQRDEAAMRAAKNLRVRVPGRVADVMADAFRAVRAVEKNPFLPDGKALLVIATRFIEVWGPQMRPRRTLSMKIRERDLGRYQAPGCSRRATHAHHVQFLSRGGTDDEWNVLSVCRGHHLIGVHEGFMTLTGRAPDEVIWAVRLGS